MEPTHPILRIRRAVRLTLALALLLAAEAGASPGAYSNASTFAAAVPGGVAGFDFESLANGTVVSGATLQPPGGAAAIVLPPPVLDVLDPTGAALVLRVVDDATDNPASSGTRSLGVEDAGNFHAITSGTSLSFGFTAPVDAFGLTVITPEEPGQALLAGDLELAVPGEATATLALAEGQPLGTFGGRAYRAYFLGVIGASPFGAATLRAGATTAPSTFFFNVDDLVIPVPEPSVASAAAVGLVWLRCLVRLRRRTTRKRIHS